MDNIYYENTDNQDCVRLKRIEDKIDKVVDNQTDMRVDIQKIKSDVAINTLDLTEHKEGVVQNRKRIVALEKPAIVLNGIKNIAVYIATIAGMIIVLKKLGILQ